MLDFQIQSTAVVSKEFKRQGIVSFAEALVFVKTVSYGRNINKSNPLCIFEDNKGTCSTKHALLKELANENGYSQLKLMLGLFKMNAINTPSVKKVLDKYDLAYIPEAHNYLKYNDTIIDCTTTKQLNFQPFLLEETEIKTNQITEHKVAYHKQYLFNWLKNNSLPYSEQEIWQIREACIAALSE